MVAHIAEIACFHDDVADQFLLNVEIELIGDRRRPVAVEECQRRVWRLSQPNCASARISNCRPGMCGKAVTEKQCVTGFPGRSHEVHRVGITQGGSRCHRIAQVRSVEDTAATSKYKT